MGDCVFCEIVAGKVPAEVEKETEHLLVFRDLHPKASIHLLMVPKKHFRDITEADGEIWEAVRKTALEIAREKATKGFRLVHNAGEAAAVGHMHVHFLGEITAERQI